MSVRRLIFYSAKYLTFKGEILLRKKMKADTFSLLGSANSVTWLRKKCALLDLYALFLKITLVYVFWGKCARVCLVAGVRFQNSHVY